jgi:enhancer of polycomb-like protein
MTEEDDEFLRALNTRTAPSTKCAEDTFEEVMDLFERTAQAKQPFAVVDSPPVLSYEELEISFDDTVEVSSLVFTKEIYQHWKKQRLKQGNKPLTPSLKVIAVTK